MNGACIRNNTCSCGERFSGDYCEVESKLLASYNNSHLYLQICIIQLLKSVVTIYVRMVLIASCEQEITFVNAYRNILAHFVRVQVR